MTNTVTDYLQRLKESRTKQRRAAAILLVLSLIVAVRVTWQLHLTGITLTGDAYCGYEEHQHGEDCTETRLVCTLEEGEGHTHDETCYAEQPVLTCGQEESAGHTHTDECYAEQTLLTCGQEEYEGHTHSEACYDADGNLICGQEESAGHTHDEACYETVRTLVCGLEESAGHTHDDSCYTAEPVLVCGQEESEGHTHTDECYEEVLTCDKPEHVHTLACYSDAGADTETSEDWEATLPDPLTDDWADNVVAIAQSQLGYQESEQNYAIDTDADGNEVKKGYTRYGAWYGNAYGDWDAMFASFCIHYAGIAQENFPYAAGAQSWISQLSDAGLYTADPGEIRAGDLVFFEETMGIVTAVTDDSLDVIAGDADGAVRALTVAGDAVTGVGLLPENPDQTPEEGAFTLTAQAANGIWVTVVGESSALPYPADEITVKAEEETDTAVLAAWEQTMAEQGALPGQSFILDITLWHNGEEIEPTGPVTVTFSGAAAAAETAETARTDEGAVYKVYRISDDAETVEDMKAVVTETGEIEMETDHFTDYGVMTANADDTQSVDAQSDDDAQGLSGYIGTALADGGTFKLTGDAWTESSGNYATLEITHNTTIDLNGHNLTISKSTQNFTVRNGATLTIIDSSKEVTESVTSGSSSLYGNEASLDDYTLTYYVTTSSASGTGTTESLEKHTVSFSGVGKITTGEASDSAIRVESGGSLNIQSGVIENNTGKHAIVTTGGTVNQSGGLVKGSTSGLDNGGGYYIGSGTLNLSGGYVAGGAVASKVGGGIYMASGTVDMTGGVVAANSANNQGGGIFVTGGTVDISGKAVVSGNKVTSAVDNNSAQTNNGGGGGIYLAAGTLNLSGGYITNNVMRCPCTASDGNGDHGGGGVAYSGSAAMTMSGGYVTGNWSNFAGGGIYAGYYGGSASFTMTGGTIASNYTNLGEGGGLRIGGGTKGVITGGYITNNMSATTYDWGGGGIFVQEGGTLNIKNSLITANTAGGFGGGVGACPTGETVVVNTDGAAIYSNTAKGEKLSGGGHGKTYDSDAYDDTTFMSSGYQDFFCVKASTNTTVIALVTGKMLGDGTANWSGSCDGSAITISQTGYAAPKFRLGLTANPGDDAIADAKAAAKVYITGNSSGTHGGGIMTNGKLILGQTGKIETTTAVELTGTKALYKDNVKQSTGLDFDFELKDASGDVVGTATSDAKTGKFSISPNVTYSKADTYTYTLSEKNDEESGVTYDTTVYTVKVVVAESSTTVADVTFVNYYVDGVTVTSSAVTKTGYTIHYQNQKGYSKPYLYVWVGSSMPLGGWPGQEITKDSNNSGWYSYTLTSSQVSGEFNYIISDSGNNNSKTGDLSATYSEGGELWVYTNTNDNNVSTSTSKPDGWVDASNVSYTGTKNADNSYTLAINPDGAAFTNYSVVEYTLPATGGPGTLHYVLIGLAFMAVPVVYGYGRRRKERGAVR